MPLLTNQAKVIFDMQTALAGTPVAEKEYIFITPQVHGLSYKLLDHSCKGFKEVVGKCWKHIEASINRNNPDLVEPEDIVLNLLKGASHIWVSFDNDGEVAGCLIMTMVKYPRRSGVMSEAAGGKFIIEDIYPIFEKFYKDRKLGFIQITGRKGWDRVMKPSGYKLDHITLYKRL
jgi:hypothetical protein